MFETSGFREVVRSVNVSYPIPFLAAVLLAFALACLGASLAAIGALRWALAGIGCFAALSAIGLVGSATLRKPELLRSEEWTLANRYIDLFGDSQMEEVIRRRAGRRPGNILGEKIPKKERNRANAAEAEDGGQPHA